MAQTSQAREPATAPRVRLDHAIPPAVTSAGVALTALLIYFAHTPVVSGDQDTAEFALVLATNGVAHPTGYPLYTMAGHLFVLALHALGAAWPYAANAWSALGGAVAVFGLHRLTVALLPPRTGGGPLARFLLGLLPVALFALNPIWTYEATLAEVNSWHVAWVLLAATAFVAVLRRMAAPSAARELPPLAAAWGFVCGLGGAHHATALLVAAPLSFVILGALVRRADVSAARKAELVLLVPLAALLPLTSYAFILWRGTHPAAVQWHALAPGWRGMIEHITAAQYWGNLGHFTPSPGQVSFLRQYVWPFLLPGLAALAAIVWLARTGLERAMRAALLLAAAAAALYARQYGVDDPASYFLAPMALGLAALAPLSAELLDRTQAPRTARTAFALVAAAAVIALWVPWLRTSRERTDEYVRYDHFLHSMWAAVPEGPVFVFWSEDMYQHLVEYQRFAHEKPEAEVVNAFTLLSPRTRAAFGAQHGFDPLAGLDAALAADSLATDRAARSRATVAFIERRVNACSPQRVIHFDPTVPTVDLLEKPNADSLAAPAR